VIFFSRQMALFASLSRLSLQLRKCTHSSIHTFAVALIILQRDGLARCAK
jgi:hypothetical protein